MMLNNRGDPAKFRDETVGNEAKRDPATAFTDSSRRKISRLAGSFSGDARGPFVSLRDTL